MSIFQRALAAAVGVRETVAGQDITYCFADQEITIPGAVLGSSTYQSEQVSDQGNAKIRMQTDDWLIDPAHLLDGATPFKPLPGHKIKVDLGDSVETYEVQKLGDEDCWRWSGPARDRIRIHVRRVNG